MNLIIFYNSFKKEFMKNTKLKYATKNIQKPT